MVTFPVFQFRIVDNIDAVGLDSWKPNNNRFVGIFDQWYLEVGNCLARSIRYNFGQYKKNVVFAYTGLFVYKDVIYTTEAISISIADIIAQVKGIIFKIPIAFV